MTDASPPTLELVAAAKGGDRDAYDRLFARAAERALLFVRLRMGPRLRSEAESLDVLQDAYLAAHRDFAAFEPRGPGSFNRWLCRLIENRLRDAADRQDAAKRPPPERAAPVSALIARARAEAGPATVAADGERRARLERALGELDDASRRAVLLRHFQGMTVDDVAHALVMSPTSVRRLLGAALVRLGAALGDGDAS
jgi:RNA polymerase sigma-70 factor (ECF subfamily)